MTFTAVARCPRTHMLGVAMATHAPAVGNRCPVVVPRMGAASVQSIADPRLTLLCTQLIRTGYHAGKVIDELRTSDPEAGLRQIGVVDAWGRAAAFTGDENFGFAGHHTDDGWLVMGNGVVGSRVIDAMAEAMRSSADELIEERLVRAVEAGGRAGGQADGHFSAALLVYGNEPFSYIDLRVDVHDEPIGELRRIFEWYRPLLPYYAERPYNPRLPRDDHWRDQQGR